MRERILITRQEVRTDAMGNHTNVQVPFCRRWAYANRTTGSEEEAGRVVKTYDITSVDNYRFRNESLTLYAKEKRHD